MKKQTQSLIICSTILALLVSILILLISMPNSEITDTSTSESVSIPEAFISKKIEDISKIQIKNLENEVNIIANKNEGNIEFTIPELASKNVSKTNVEDFMKVIREFRDKGTSIIFSSHRMEHVELFCEKLVILVKGKSVLSGSLKDIKKNYQKKNIIIDASVDENILRSLKGVEEVNKVSNEFIVKIKSDKYIKTVFDYVKECDNVLKFSVEDASLNEIFVETVGGLYEE